MELGSFNDKRVLVTGASSGIGAAVAEALLARGAQLSILANVKQIHSTAEVLSATHRQPVRAIQCDITHLEMVQEKLAALSGIDVLVNNAGLELITPVDDLTDQMAQRFKRIIDINVTGTYYVTRSALPKMMAGGRIVITSSIWGKTAVAEFSAYCASKHANLGFTRALAHELAPRGITVNALCPRLGEDGCRAAVPQVHGGARGGCGAGGACADRRESGNRRLAGAARHRRPLPVCGVRNGGQHHRPGAQCRSRRSHAATRVCSGSGGS